MPFAFADKISTTSPKKVILPCNCGFNTSIGVIKIWDDVILIKKKKKLR